MFEQFWKVADQFTIFTNSEKKEIEKAFFFREVPKNQVVVDLGETATEIYFILSGIMRFYYLTDDGREITGYIFEENMFAGAQESFFSQTPSTQIVESLEECKLLVLEHEKLEELFRKVPRMNEFIRKLIQKRFTHAQNLLASLIIHKPEERYHKIIENRPSLAQRIPQHILATFIGITPVSLSRIRGRKKS